MPTQETLEGSPSAKETKDGKPSDTSVKEALAAAKKSLPDTPECTVSEMSKSEALAVAWTGVEALAQMGSAKIYLSRKSGRVWIELLATSYDSANGLISL